jgi:hypothetical protein
MHELLKKASLDALILLCAVLVRPFAVKPGASTDGLKAAVEKVLAIMQNPAYAAPQKQ